MRIQLMGPPDRLLLLESKQPARGSGLGFWDFVALPVLFASFMSGMAGASVYWLSVLYARRNGLSVAGEEGMIFAFFGLAAGAAGVLVLVSRLSHWSEVSTVTVRQEFSQPEVELVEDEPGGAESEDIPVNYGEALVGELTREPGAVLVSHGAAEHEFSGQDVEQLKRWILEGMRTIRRRPSSVGDPGLVELDSVSEANYDLVFRIFAQNDYVKRMGNRNVLTEAFYTHFGIPHPDRGESENS